MIEETSNLNGRLKLYFICTSLQIAFFMFRLLYCNDVTVISITATKKSLPDFNMNYTLSKLTATFTKMK